jgi:hypothetical protein
MSSEAYNDLLTRTLLMERDIKEKKEKEEKEATPKPAVVQGITAKIKRKGK